MEQNQAPVSSMIGKPQMVGSGRLEAPETYPPEPVQETPMERFSREAKWSLRTKIDISDIPTGHQDRDEMMWLLERISGVKSILEVGTAEGSTLLMFVRAAARGAKIRSIDNTRSPLCCERIEKLRKSGYDIEQKLADSKASEAIEWARTNGPYDFIFVDADHGPAVWIDWQNYSPMASKFIAFHDISVPHNFVRALWEERIKPSYDTEEILRDPQQCGIGLVKK